MNPYQPWELSLNGRILSNNLELTFQDLETLIEEKKYSRYFPLTDYISIKNSLDYFLNNYDNIKVGDEVSFLLEDGTIATKEVVQLWCETTRVVFVTREYLFSDVVFIGLAERCNGR